MKSQIILLSLVMALALLLTGGCADMSLLQIKVPASIGLDAATLQRIDEVNKTIRTGFEVGPKTRRDIEDLNATLREGFGLDPETLQRIDRLLADIEAGVEIGLDYETRQTLEKLIATLGAAPGDWGDTLDEIIGKLEGSSSKIADKMAGQVRNLMTEATLDLQKVGASTGQEFRCNVDYLGAKLTNTVNDFIGLSLVDRLNAIIFGKKIVPGKLAPGVCQVLPSQVTLEKVGQELHPREDVIIITGYNFADTNTNRPQVYLDKGDSERKAVKPSITTPYLIQLNLQPVDFTGVSKGSEIVFVWPAGAQYSMLVLLPEEAAPEPQVVVNIRTGILKGPGIRYHEVWPGEASQSFKVVGRNGDRTWWQIEYKDKNDNLQKGWIAADRVTASHVEDVPVASVPNPPAAGFEAVPVQGDPMSIRFEDRSVGEHLKYAWDFGDGSSTSTPTDSAPVHNFGQARDFKVKLRVTDDWGWDEIEKTVSIVVRERVTAQFDFSADPPTGVRPLVVTFNNHSTGPITSVEWNFGDGTTLNDMSAQVVHIYERPGTYPVTLTVRDDSVPNSSNTKKDVSITVKSFFKRAVFFQWYRGLERGVDLDTGIDSNQYYCGIVGLNVSGDIEEDGRGDIVKAYARRGGATWWITASFRTENPTAQKWDINLMCLDNRASDSFTFYSYGSAGRDRYPGPAPDLADTGMSTNDYLCGIVGFEAVDGDIQENGAPGTVFEVMPGRKEDTQTWGFSADIATHGTHERWNRLDVLCVVNDPTLFAFETFQIKSGEQDALIVRSDGVPYLRDNYICGLVGMGIYRADIDEKVYGQILAAHLGWNNRGWFARVNFATEGSAFAASRAGAALCVSTSIAAEQ